MFRPKSSATLAAGFESGRLPYLYSGDLGSACGTIRDLGYDAVELLVPSPDLFSKSEIERSISGRGLEASAIGTGGAYISRGLHLCSPNPSIRDSAERFIEGIVDLAVPFGAKVILGLVTGFLEQDVARETALGWLVPSLDRLGDYAAERKSVLVIEPLNRYESNLINTLEDGLELLGLLNVGNIELLADCFHMNIEETSIADALIRAGSAIGHVHFSDSNRRAPGLGHTDFAPVVEALENISYTGYISMEVLPRPDANRAARQAIDAYRCWFSTV